MNRIKTHGLPGALAAVLALGMLAPLVSCSNRGSGTLKVGLMPAVNSIPLLVAEEAGYFEDEGVEVELVMFSAQLYREAALQGGEIDGTVSDMINAIGELESGLAIRVTSLSDGRFSLLTAPDSPIRSFEDWRALPPDRKVKTGLLENSIVNYATERMLERAGADPSHIDLIPTVQIPARLEMLLSGELEAACLPEPITRVALAGGARLLGETDVLPEPPGVILFTAKALSDKEREIKAMYRAYNRAVKELSADADAWRGVIVEKGQFPPAAKDTMVLPAYGPASLPSEAVYADVANWMVEKGLVRNAPAYREIVAGGFLPSD